MYMATIVRRGNGINLMKVVGENLFDVMESFFEAFTRLKATQYSMQGVLYCPDGTTTEWEWCCEMNKSDIELSGLEWIGDYDKEEE